MLCYFAKEMGAMTVAMVLFVPFDKWKYGIMEGVHEVIHYLLYEFAVLLEK
ncbi:hypothetical protein LEP1GSC168_3381 [Leptospira santarosai str. HAI134]|uniref:Uncharacterized protein n=2 Tax=Leptospira santarosai TaxID=28183 RepID=M6V8B2_9LEPT|nr:hypothetical protein LEP1GSC063_3036 [Leptospira santarosai serovar Arenal str. MAVJ 401]EMO24285.1 hypothetical protein LEP1GSC168_3381 [Leptospira santarosai str. HAI134]EMO45753.1 hypothetical protein LEP1GSC187_1477 [Leptospira santarosai str. ZUN179]